MKLIDVIDKQQCSGCGACAQKCPRQCISLKGDKEGFLYPSVDSEICIDCGSCEKVCPTLNPYDVRMPIQTLAAINKNEPIRLQSSSGGIFTLLAEPIIHEGGVVFGARFDHQWQVTIDYTETLDGLALFRGCKYVQARTGNTFKQCEKFLKDGRKVLFSGTPCQIAGLKHFLGKEYDRLLTVEIGCHGTPSPKVWSLYLEETTGSIADIEHISMREKSQGWQQYSVSITFKKEHETIVFSVPYGKNDFMNAFLNNMILRPSCYNCSSKQGRSGSDFTIADYWGIQSVAPEMNDGKGIGLVLINSPKGQAFFSQLDLVKRETSFEEGYRNNSAIVKSVNPWHRRDSFFSKLDETESVVSLIRSELQPTIRMVLKAKFKTILSLPKRIILSNK